MGFVFSAWVGLALRAGLNFRDLSEFLVKSRVGTQVGAESRPHRRLQAGGDWRYFDFAISTA